MVKFFLIPLTLLAASVQAADKDQYTVFNPVPKGQMRPFTTDRPDRAENPRTLDAGHFLIETDLLNYTFQRSGGDTTSTLYITDMNLKTGLTNHTDIQFVVGPFVSTKTKPKNGPSESKRGFADTIVRLKHNFFGNDDESTGAVALGIIPFIKLPTAGAGMSNGHSEGGLALTMGLHLPNEWYGEFTVDGYHLRKADDRGWQTDQSIAASFSHAWSHKFTTFFEFYQQASDNKNQGTYSALDLGAMYLLTPTLQLDAGCFFGLTEAAEDYNPFVGLSALY